MGGRGLTTVVWPRWTRRACYVMVARRSRGAANWPKPASLDAGRNCGSPLVAMNGGGDTAATWYKRAGGHGSVEAAVRTAGGPWHVRTMPSSTDHGASEGNVALDAAGNATVTWIDRNERLENSDRRVVSARRPVGGPWDSPTFLSGEDDWAAVPLVAMGRAGTTTVVWALHTFPGDYFHYRSVQGVQRAPGVPGAKCRRCRTVRPQTPRERFRWPWTPRTAQWSSGPRSTAPPRGSWSPRAEEQRPVCGGRRTVVSVVSFEDRRPSDPSTSAPADGVAKPRRG